MHDASACLSISAVSGENLNSQDHECEMEMEDNETIGVLIENSDNTTSLEARSGKDIQGITWKTETSDYKSRDEFRRFRLERLWIVEPRPLIVEQAKQGCQPTLKGGIYYDYFKYNNCLMPFKQDYSPDYGGMLWCTSRHDLYFCSRYKIGHLNALTSRTTEVLDVKGHVVPSKEHPGNHMHGFTKTCIEAMAVGHKLLIIGGNYGELICKHLNRPGVSFCFQLENEAKINSIEIFKRPTATSEAINFVASDQGGGVDIFDVEKTFQFSHFQFPWPVKHASSSPDGRQLVVVGDDPEGRLVDSESGSTIQSFRGHFGCSCSSAWHPDGNMFATGNTDRTCRIWDVRNLLQPVAALEGNATAISSISFTSDGRFMAMCEDVDFVHVYDVQDAFRREQEIDLFGHVSGLSFSPDTEYLFISVSIDTVPTLLSYQRRHRIYHYLDSMN
ncbi:putative WD repeat-containing protein [Glycine soja]